MAIRIQRSPGNVFADLGFPPEEAAHLLIRADLMGKVRSTPPLSPTPRRDEPGVGNLRRSLGGEFHEIIESKVRTNVAIIVKCGARRLQSAMHLTCS